MTRRPYVGIVVPLAATRFEVRTQERSAGVAGKTLSSAPESIKKCLLKVNSKMEIEEGTAPEEEEEGEEDGVGNGKPAAAISDRPWSFPEPKLEDAFGLGCALDTWTICTNKPWRRTSDE